MSGFIALLTKNHMHKKIILAGLVLAGLSGCGMQGPLYLPPNPDDSYLSRIEKTLNEMTGQTTAVIAEPKDDADVVITDPEKLDIEKASNEKAGKSDTASSINETGKSAELDSNVIHETDKPAEK